MKRICALFLCLATQYCLAEATDSSPCPSCPNGFQIGLGGSYNSLTISQSMSGIGISDVFDSAGTLVATGEASGVTVPYRETKSIFSPEGVIGYFHHFGNSPWFLGTKFFYQYLGLTFSNGPIDSPQSGEFTSVAGSDTFFGNAIIQSSQSQVNHELVLMPFFGRSLNNTHFYLGGGGAVFQVDFYQYNFIGFADINGVHSDITGKPVNFFNSLWMWGGGGQVGLTHYFHPKWFIDCSYTYLVTANYTFSDLAPFSSSIFTSDGTTFTTAGTAVVDAKQRITVQSYTFVLNILF